MKKIYGDILKMHGKKRRIVNLVEIFYYILYFILYLIAHIILNILVTSSVTLFTVLKPNRINAYNDLLRDFTSTLDEAQVLADKYWTSKSKSKEVIANLRSIRTKINDLECRISNKNCNLYNRHREEISDKIEKYFDIITEFGKNPKGISSDTRLSNANNFLSELKTFIVKSDFPSTIWHRIFTCIK